MKLVIQRIKKATVSVKGQIVGEIGIGLFVLLGVGKEDSEEDSVRLADKLVKLRIMSDSEDKMNLTVNAVNGSVLVVSQFTLYANTDGGNRPSFVEAGQPETARKLYEHFVGYLKSNIKNVQTGKFGEYMRIEAELDGPVTILMDSKKNVSNEK